MARPERALLLTLCLVGPGLGCGESSLLERSDDLIHGAPAVPEQAAHPAGPSTVLEAHIGIPTAVHCGDRSNFAVPLRGGMQGSAVFLTGRKPRLLLSGCRPGGKVPPDEPQGVLLFTLHGNDGHRRDAEVRIPRHGKWWWQTLDLGELEDEVLQLHFKVRLPPGEQLYLSELVLQHAVPAPPANPVARQVLLVSIDTLRADEIPGNGDSALARLPAFARLASAAERWEPHYAAASWTQPSHASLLTGQPLGVHGANDHALHPAVPTLAERLRAAGFRTGASVYDCVWLGEKFGFNRGFEDYRVGKWWMHTAIRHALGWMGDHRGDDFFYFLHVYEPHSDYRRLPYESLDTTPETVRGWGFPGYGCRQGECASRLLRGMLDGTIQPIDGEAEVLRRLYRGGIRDTDRGLEELLEGLEQLGIRDNLLLIVTSDHGEFFLEHGQLLHGGFWEEGLRVPLFIKWPEGRHAGTTRAEPSSALDLAPTILSLSDLPAEDLPGTPLDQRRDGGLARPVLIEAPAWQAMILAGKTGPGETGNRDHRWKFIENRASGELRLFDLREDPREFHNLAPQQPAEVERLLALLERYREHSARTLEEAERRQRRGPVADLTPEEQQRLRSLGYL